MYQEERESQERLFWICSKLEDIIAKGGRISKVIKKRKKKMDMCKLRKRCHDIVYK